MFTEFKLFYSINFNLINTRSTVASLCRFIYYLPVTADQVIVEEIVEGAAHIAEAVGRVDEERLGSSEALAGSEDPLEGAFVDAALGAQQVERVELQLRREVAAVQQRDAVGFAGRR